MSDLNTLAQLVDHLYKRIDFLEGAVIDALGEANPRAAARLKAEVGKVYKTPAAAIRAADYSGADHDLDLEVQKVLGKEVGPDPGWEGTPWAGGRKR